MSIEQMVRVWSCDVSIVEQAILMALADHAHDDGTKVYPSVARIAWKVGASRATVQRTLQRFRGSGVLVVVLLGGGRQPTEYTLHLDKLAQKPPLRKRDLPQAEAGSSSETSLTVRPHPPQPEAGTSDTRLTVRPHPPQPEAAGASGRGGSRLTAVRPYPSSNHQLSEEAAAGRATPAGAPAATKAEVELEKLMARREAIGLGDFRDPLEGESVEDYRRAQNDEWNRRQPRTDPRFADTKAAAS